MKKKKFLLALILGSLFLNSTSFAGDGLSKVYSKNGISLFLFGDNSGNFKVIIENTTENDMLDVKLESKDINGLELVAGKEIYIGDVKAKERKVLGEKTIQFIVKEAVKNKKLTKTGIDGVEKIYIPFAIAGFCGVMYLLLSKNKNSKKLMSLLLASTLATSSLASGFTYAKETYNNIENVNGQILINGEYYEYSGVLMWNDPNDNKKENTSNKEDTPLNTDHLKDTDKQKDNSGNDKLNNSDKTEVTDDKKENQEFSFDILGADVKTNIETGNLKKNTEVIVTLSPEAKYHPFEFLVNGENLVTDLKSTKVGEHQYTFEYKFNIKKNTEIRVNYEKFCELELEGEGLSSIPSTETRVKPGTEVTVFINSKEGKTLKSLIRSDKNFPDGINMLGQVKKNQYKFNLDTCTKIKAEYKDIEANPESDFTFNERTQTITDYNYAGAKDVIIPSHINGKEVKHIYEYAFYSKGLNSVKLPETIETIGDQAFYDNSITNITIPNSVKVIGVGAFAENLISNLVLSDNVESFGAGAFMGNKIKEFKIPINLTEIPRRLLERNELTKIEIPNNILKINERAFYKNNLSNVDFLGNLNFIDKLAFAENKLNEISLNSDAKVYPNAFDFGVKTNISNNANYIVPSDDEFEFDENTKTILDYTGNDWNIEIPAEINGIKVEKIGFKNNWDEENGIKGAFEKKSLNKIKISEGIKIIDKDAFRGNGLVEVVLPSTLEDIGSGAFAENNLTNIKLPNISIINEETFKDNKITNIDLSNIVEIKKAAFANNKITNIKLPENLTTIEDETFQNNLLSDINIPNNIQKICKSAFASNQITKLEIPNSINIIDDGAFSSNKITNLVIPENVKTIGKSAFAFNIIKTLEIKGNTELLNKAFYTNKITDLKLSDEVLIKEGETFQFNGLQEIKIPKATKKIPHLAFAANQISKVIFHDQVEEIGYGALYVNKLTEVTIPNSVKIIGNAAFFNNNISKLVLPNSLEVIDEGTFRMNKLTEVTIPDSVKLIKNGAFKENKIKEVTLHSISNDAFDKDVIVNKK